MRYLVNQSLKKKEDSNFWQKPKVAKTFTHFVRDSAFCVGDSVDSQNLAWNLRWILQNYPFWLIGVGKGKRDSTFGESQKQQKLFNSTEQQNRLVNYALRGGNKVKTFRFCDFGLFFLRDSTQSAESCENKNKADSQNLAEILWNRGIQGGFCEFMESNVDSAELQNRLVNYALRGGNKTKVFKILLCGIEGGFCEFGFWILDSVELQNRW